MSQQPVECGIERVFMARNPDSALKLGQARGAAICAVVSRGIAVHEYAATEVKQSVVGTGHGDKTQVQHMVGVLLGLQGPAAGRCRRCAGHRDHPCAHARQHGASGHSAHGVAAAPVMRATRVWA